jgi:hypothetical protein
VLKDVTKEIGGVPYRKKINFMSRHPDSYIQLRANPEFVKVIATQEEEMGKRTMYHIPKSKVKKVASRIKDGDIIGITTAIEGLDCIHTGIAIWQAKKLRMIHASIPGSKVQITEVPLSEYLMKIKKDTGLMLARAMEIKT